ncbi:hypothetical protein SAMN05444267_101647 [Chryseobacterium polytrichastri]|uniref:Uncharacterized protein n=1 Tax=Chryseobacterium polytrichastri TaxID=1302687 RepID=A0A1M6ZV12_9FLAO|nr:hypothetical protein SAMN05444267_101647 [Chryseobacterium polytrichastri]
MKKIKDYILPLIFLYLSVICLYVSYLFIIDDYNISKSIYQPYKSFIQLSPFDNWNVFITIFKGIFGVIGFIKYVFTKKLINYFNTLFLSITLFEIIIQLYFQIRKFENFSVYIDFYSVIISGILFVILGVFYFKSVKIKKIFPQILLGLFLTVLSYCLH